MRILRQYQERLIHQGAVLAAKGHKRIILQAPTGAGKSVIFASLIERYLRKQQRRVLIACHREKLVRQSRKALFDWYGIVAHAVFAETKQLPPSLVYAGMAETLYRRFEKNPNYIKNIGLLVIDECHLGLFTKLFDHFPDTLIIGFTATPIAAKKTMPLKDVYNELVEGPQISELIAEGSLTKNLTYHIKNIDRKKLKVKNGEFDDVYMGKVMSGTKHVQNAIAAYQNYCKGKKTIIFNSSIEHSKVVNEAFLSFGYPAKHLDGYMSKHEADKVLQWFENTPGAILNNVAIATTGFDIPTIEAVMLNKGTKSLPLFLQMCGRGSRLAPNKPSFTIIDMAGNVYEHGDWSDDRRWSEIFHNPEKPKEGGEAPVKECISCSVVIHLSQKICPHCGAINARTQKYDDDIVVLELLNNKKPIVIDMPALVEEYNNKVKADGTPYNQMAALHAIKRQIITHVKYTWRIKKVDEKTAKKLIAIYHDFIKQWCQLKDKKFTWWLENTSKEWLYDELKKTFKYEPEKQVA